MAAFACEIAPNRSAETWKGVLDRFADLEFVVADAGGGIASAVETIAAEQVAAAAGDGVETGETTCAAKPAEEVAATAVPRLEQGLDLFHTTREAMRALGRRRRETVKLWEAAEAADVRKSGDQTQGRSCLKSARKATRAWQKAAAAMERWDRQKSAWRDVRAAFEAFDDAGRLNERARAEREIEAGLAELPGRERAKTRRFARDRRSLAFLDRLHRRLEQAEPCPFQREAMVRRWWLRHRRGVAPPAAERSPLSALAATLEESVRVGKLKKAEEVESYARVSAILRDVLRASSAVECLNGVLRLDATHHRRMTQTMLDLKRLYWNTRRFQTGPRRKKSPYEWFGICLPTFDFWELLQTDPRELTRQLSTCGNAK
jgi:hypothetical protein